MLAAVACGGAHPPGSPAPGDPERFGHPLGTYQQLGFIAGPAAFPVVASFSTMKGPADSSFVLLGLSLPASALRFQREGSGFAGEYAVALTFAQDSQVVKRLDRHETVRVPTFAETTRTDESIVFQQTTAVPPGRYEVTLEVSDANSSRGLRMRDTLAIRRYGAGGSHLTDPVIVYEGTGRSRPDTLPDLILNPRHTMAYGGAAPRLYIEAYDAAAPVPVAVRVIDEADNTVWSARTTIEQGDDTLRRALLDLPASMLPLGKLWVEVAGVDQDTAVTRTPIIISISDQWVVANFGDMLDFLRYIATNAELDSLSDGAPADRRARFDRFWARRDPLPATPVNEFRDEFFERVRLATERFGEEGGQPGWRTDRGEVYIVLGPPDFVQERFIGRDDVSGRPNAYEWLYESLPGGRLNLLFLDRGGFGRYELAPSSEAAFRAVAERMKPQENER